MSERDVISAELELVTQNLCAMMLHASVTEMTEGCAEWGVHTFRSSVAIHGDWSGSLELTTSTLAAKLMARSLFGCAAVDDQQCLDAVREVSNILAGNIKSALPGITRLAIPEVSLEGRPDHTHAESSIVSMYWRFGALDEVLAVTVRRAN